MVSKKKVYEIIGLNGDNKWNRFFNLSMMFLILINIVILFVTTLDVREELQLRLNNIEMLIGIVFSVEYVLRFWTANYLYPEHSWLRARICYIKSPMAVIDMLSILPVFLPFLLPASFSSIRALRVIRIFRIVKLHRYTDAFVSVGSVFKLKAKQLFVSFLLVGVLMLISSLLIYGAEHEVQPDKFANAFSGLWWAVATLTTVGYGDIYPLTALGKILSSIIALLGIGMVAVPTGIISAGFLEVMTCKEKESKHEAFRYCPHCGGKLFEHTEK